MAQKEQEEEYTHCLMCRRRLKNPKWRKTGMGAKCYQKSLKVKKKEVVQLELDLK